MKRKLLLFLLSICFFLPDFAATGQYNFIRVDGGSGLSNSHVKSIIQDSYGFIWLGTRNGLNRYDGVSMKLYNCYDETLQHGNQVRMMVFIFKSLLPGSFRSLMPAQRAESKSDTTGLKIFWQIIQEISG